MFQTTNQIYMCLTKLPNYGLLVLVATDVLKYIYIQKLGIQSGTAERRNTQFGKLDQFQPHFIHSMKQNVERPGKRILKTHQEGIHSKNFMIGRANCATASSTLPRALPRALPRPKAFQALGHKGPIVFMNSFQKVHVLVGGFNQPV